MTAENVLRECPVFSALSNTELDKIAGSASEKEYEAGTTVFHEGDTADELLILQEGKVALQMTLQAEQGQVSRRITVDVATRNEVIGWSAVVEPYIYTLSAVCLQKVKVLSISGAGLRGLLQDSPGVGYQVLMGLIKVVVDRLNDTRRVLVSERSLTPTSE